MIFHSYPKRQIRDGERTHQNLRVVSVRCKQRQSRKEHPYTIRFLPPNVIPRSPLLMDRLVEVIGNASSPGKVDVEEACEALACIDLRTARKHLRYLFTIIPRISILAGRLAATLETSTSSELVPPGTGPLEVLALVWFRFLETAKLLFGLDRARRLDDLLWLAPGIGRSLTAPTGRVSEPRFVHDTS